jgi:hypothetical protein
MDRRGDRGTPLAQIAGEAIREGEGGMMTTRPRDAIAPASNAARRPPVRVRLKRINANYSKPYPPDGLAKEWWARLQKALGTSSSAFVNATLLQLQMACRTPYAGISETAVNAALAMVEAAAPRDECQSASKIDPRSAFKIDPLFGRSAQR